jgi:hypothetical protein
MRTGALTPVPLTATVLRAKVMILVPSRATAVTRVGGV